MKNVLFKQKKDKIMK